MKVCVRPRSVFILIVLGAFAPLSACGPSEKALAFQKANNTARISAPVTEDLWAALDCSAATHALDKNFSLFARTKITMQVRDGFAQPPAVLTNLEGARRVFAVYGFYTSK